MAIPPAAKGQPSISLAQASHHLATELSPDFIGVQECDFNLSRSASTNQIAEIAKSIGAAHFAFAPSIIGTPSEKWRKLNPSDQRVITNLDLARSENGSEKFEGGYGIAIASKIEVIKWHHLELGNSSLGMPLLIPGDESGPGKVRPIYIRDEPRVALAATLVDGYTIINTHLSFVPGYNVKQLHTLKKWAAELERETGTIAIIMGDLNLPKNLPVVASQWKSLNTQATYPSWGAKIQFDYILSKAPVKAKALATVNTRVSDHLPLSVEITH